MHVQTKMRNNCKLSLTDGVTDEILTVADKPLTWPVIDLAARLRFLETVRGTGFVVGPQPALVSTQSHNQFPTKAVSAARKVARA
jgi:hypothetical protein